MVFASHVIFSAYGFWLPNDPRGSYSDFVRKWELVRFGKATQVGTTRSLARHAHDGAKRREAKAALRYPPVVFSGQQARAIVAGFKVNVEKTGAAVYACSILPEHVHMVLAAKEYDVEQLVGLFKGEATKQLIRQGLHPFTPTEAEKLASPWGRRCWKVFLDEAAGIRRAIAYVEANPMKEGKRAQRWSFVTAF